MIIGRFWDLLHCYLFSADISIKGKPPGKACKERVRFIMASQRTRLEKVIAAWPNLPGHIKAAIHDIVQANIMYANSWVLWPGRVSRLRGDDRDHQKGHRTVYEAKQKRCIKCKQWKDETQFYTSRRSKDGLTGRCKECSSKVVKKDSKKVMVKK